MGCQYLVNLPTTCFQYDCNLSAYHTAVQAIFSFIPESRPVTDVRPFGCQNMSSKPDDSDTTQKIY